MTGFEGCWTWGTDTAKTQLANLLAKDVGGERGRFIERPMHLMRMGNRRQNGEIHLDRSRIPHGKRTGHEFNALFDSKEEIKIFQALLKAIATLTRCMQMVGDSDALIIDFFSGSATTAHAVMAQNLADGGHFQAATSLVQLPEPMLKKPARLSRPDSAPSPKLARNAYAGPGRYSRTTGLRLAESLT